MHSLSSLLKELPSLHESRMSGSGYAVWIVWDETLSDAIPSTFRDFGGLEIVSESRQALWFFYSKDVFQAMARLQIWANLNSLPVFIEILPTSLLIGFQLERTLSMATEFYNQKVMPPQEFDVLVHSKLQEDVENTPGITLVKVERPDKDLAPGNWYNLVGDPRIGFTSTLGWYFVLKPLGNPTDMSFIEGWRSFFTEIEVLLKKFKLKYIMKEDFLLFELDSYKTLIVWCREVLGLLRAVKEDEERFYWPSVMVAVEKAGYQFNEDMPSKVPLDWSQMAPDFPHMNYRTAFLMGDQFAIKDVSYSFERSRLTDWCYVHLMDGDEMDVAGDLNITMPVALLAGGQRPCFYCGLRNHTEAECPSKVLTDLDDSVWSEIGTMSLERMNQSLGELGTKVKDAPLEALPGLLKAQGEAGNITRAIYDINAPVQLRCASLVWRSIGKELPSGFYKLAPRERSPHMLALDEFLAGNAGEAETAAKQGALRNPKDYPFRTLLGFIVMERGDMDKAIEYWKEAELLGSSPIHFAYHKFLQARALEIEGRFDQSTALYKEAAVLCPKWIEPTYRQAVCMVKMGFSEHAVGLIDQLIDQDSNMFNRIILDPEAERGYIQILSNLYLRWIQASDAAKDSLEKLRALVDEVREWFGKDHEFEKKSYRQIQNLLQLDGIENFVVFNRLIRGRMRLAQSLKERVEAEARILTRQAETFRDRLKAIHGDISWFPFPKALREFNRDFNYCVTKLNWVKQQHFKIPKNFRKSHEFFKEVEIKLGRLKSRLVTLKIVRDATLFVLLLGKSFMWIEIVGLGLALLGMPVTVFLGEYWDLSWITEYIESQRWALQKGLVIAVSLAAFIIALLRTAIVFEKKKEKFFDEQRQLADKLARERPKKKSPAR